MMFVRSLLKEESALQFAEDEQTGSEGLVAEPKATYRGAGIKWECFNPNMTMTAGADGAYSFQRTKMGEHDVALGQAITSGIHEWIVVAPNWNVNQYVGVALAEVDSRMFPAGTAAWAMHLHSGDLCSGAASVLQNRTYTDENGARGYISVNGSQHFLSPIALKGAGKRNAMWERTPVPRGVPVRVILDMEAHILSFGIGDQEPQLAFTSLPSSVNPYICSGNLGEKSLIEVYGASC